MNKKVFMVAYNPTAPFNQDIFHGYINSLFVAGHISDWWHYTPNFYLVVSALGVNQLYNHIFPGVPRRYLLIMEVVPTNTQGWLPEAAWQWIQKYWPKKVTPLFLPSGQK